MKTLLIIFALFTITICSAQSDSLSINQRLKLVENNLTNMGDDLIGFHEQYQDGICVTIIGLMMNVGGICLYDYNEDIGIALLYGGMATMTVGLVVTIDAHRYIKKAGENLSFTLSPKQVGVKLNF